ncbi:flagellar assembly factor FliW [Clostridium acetobutylicum]|uniref:Flagellar assembly factor FliW n=1 Tax=Clostridium acetobutylicum (strain ATCC 824 / DSM 792 / JCM 1419 / IAM 19013 / LMG 5710 / NBRC 13948 / NRRL B-527 / VKM B-1787 / 2291 / W) TaxID=272562 RepID=FLIW_CLOAB|nr:MULTISPECIES: flagellar assembly protein FliW [Clostridium]Q97H05.1 RecName: Full=Flagellar assembly factor FliW [Clostridium acetobutylicum ATCC 824]AAK80167.1 Uncharacterized protein, YVIF B.subtilis homolog [Clostridium acetobutylicum ATCC 824]ADZ21261.1 flagellar assembly protein FliW [Clostridium acetobutylicum EA 2018]AEI34065.1 flagellar assembly protein FliW [Clostridium acetobutylicum DSM 1731]AWV79407.1 flagellar assembly protein FliW [Clostridium acetobutylicum]KHD38353.1 flagel
MKLETQYHGIIEYNENNIINLVKGMSGFENLKKFILVGIENNEVFSLFHSMEDKETAFIVSSPFYVKADYEVNLSEELVKELKIDSEKDVLIINTVNLSKDIKKMTTNLGAPIIININKHLGKQIIISDDEKMIKYPMIHS